MTLPRSTWTRTVVVTLVAALPAVTDWLARVVVSPRPFWAYWCDPEAMYFYSSLELLRGQAPLDIDNPGTPVQALGAVLAWLTGGGPEHFASFLTLGYVAILVATLAGCIVLARRFERDLGAVGVIGVAWLYFLCPQAMARGVVWAAEPFQFLGGALLLVALDRALKRPGRPRRSFVAGLAVGALVGLKFTFLGFVPALMVGLLCTGPENRAKRMAAGWIGAAVGFFAATLPAAARWPRMIQRVVDVATPGGPPVWADAVAPPTYLDGLLLPLRSGTVWYGLVGALVVAWVGLAWTRRREDGAIRRRDVALAVFAIGALVLTHTAAAKSTYLRYHLPGGVAAMGIAIAFLRAVPVPRRAVVTRALALVVLVAVVRQIVMTRTWHERLIREHVELRGAAQAAIELDALARGRGENPPVVLYGGRFPHPALALLLFSRTDAERERIAALHPTSGLYDRRGRRIVLPAVVRWDYLVLEDHDLATFPEAHGAVIGTVGAGNTTSSTYRIVRR